MQQTCSRQQAAAHRQAGGAGGQVGRKQPSIGGTSNRAGQNCSTGCLTACTCASAPHLEVSVHDLALVQVVHAAAHLHRNLEHGADAQRPRLHRCNAGLRRQLGGRGTAHCCSIHHSPARLPCQSSACQQAAEVGCLMVAAPAAGASPTTSPSPDPASVSAPCGCSRTRSRRS